MQSSTLALAAALIIPPGGDAAAGCAEVEAAARRAEAAVDVDRTAALLQAAADPAAACGDDYVAGLRRDLANLHVERFFQDHAPAAGAGPDARRASLRRGLPLLERGLAVAETWQVALVLAEARHELGQHDLALPLYQRAMTLLAEAEAMPADAPERRNLPDPDGFAAVHGNMVVSALLADGYEAPPVTRGRPDAGYFVESYRGFTVKAVPLPVQFEFGSTAFTEKGRRAAAHLAAYLAASGKPEITLVGHTDRVGDEASNDALSLARAEALRDFLVAEGYQGSIGTQGRGEREPFRTADRDILADPAMRDALDRRVELLR